MKITAAQLTKIAGGKPKADNVNSVVIALDGYAVKTGLDKPHRLAQFLAQTAHESGGFKYDREIWGPTAAQRGYARTSATRSRATERSSPGAARSS